MTPDEKKEFQAIVEELVSVGRENQPKRESARLPFKEGVTAVYQSLAALVILLGVFAYVLTMRGDVNANREAIVQLRADIATARGAGDSTNERLRLLELKVSRLEK